MTPVITFDTLDSTNAEARRRAEAGERGPVWLLARHQSAGRGRRGRTWDGGHGNLTATLLMTLDRSAGEAGALAFVTALAVGRMADNFVPPSLIRFKWPNDILLDGHKLSGALIESGPAVAGGLWLAVGVGVNLATYPTEVERPATALKNHLSHGVIQAPSQDQAMDVLSRTFDVVLGQWLAEGFAPIREAWLARAVGIGGPCTARLAHETVVGTAEGLDVDGALLLRLPTGALRRIAAGDVFFGGP